MIKKTGNKRFTNEVTMAKREYPPARSVKYNTDGASKENQEQVRMPIV